MRQVWLVAAVLGLCSIATGQPTRPAPVRTELAPGIFLFSTAPYGDAGLDGNSIAVLSRDGVLVFDTNGTASASAAVLAQIRTLTDQPVRYVVNSHWHWDHWYGTDTYVQAFPDVKVVSSAKNALLMGAPAVAFNRPFLEVQFPPYLAALEAKAETSPTAKALFEEDRWFFEQKTRARLVTPSTTFTDRMTIQMGERRIELLNLGRGVTPGDTIAWLPAEKVLLVGDLVVNPITFALSGYPTEWVRVLEQLEGFDATTIVTGHGDPLHDRTLIETTLAIFRTLLREGRRLKTDGKTADEARDLIYPGLHDLMVRLTHDDPGRNGAFKVQMVDWFLHRVYDELDGPLSDAIAPIPRS